jgi:hypothetical protein
MALRPETLAFVQDRYGLPPLAPPGAPGGLAPMPPPAPPAPPVPPPPMAAPPPVAPPPPSPAPRLPAPAPGLVAQQQTITPGVDTSAAQAAVAGATERAASAQQQAGADVAAAVRAEAEEKAAGARAAEQQAIVAREQQADVRRAAESRVNELMAEEDEQVNPRQFFEQIGTGGTVLAVLAAGLTGALRAVANNKAPGSFDPDRNPIVDALNTQVSRSMQAQQANIQNRRAQRSQAISIEMQRWGNAQQAELALQARAQEHAARYYDLQAERHRGTPIEANARAAAEATRAEGQKKRAELALLEQPRVSTTYARPQPAAAADPREAFAKWLDVEKKLEEAGYTREQRAQARQALGVPESFAPQGETAREQSTRERGEKAAADEKRREESFTDIQAKAESAHQTLRELALEAGLTRNPKTGKWEPPSGVSGVLTTIENVAKTQAGRASMGVYQPALKVKFDAAVEAFGRQQSGGQIGKEELPAFAEQLGGTTFSPGQLAERLNAAELNIEAKRKEQRREIEGQLPPEEWK